MIVEAEPDLCEEKIRRYLCWIADPSSLVDRKLVQRLQTLFDNEPDVLAKLRLAEELERAERPSTDDAKSGFFECAVQYSKDLNLSAAAFLRLGVPAEDLRHAGLEVESAPAGSRGQRALHVSSDTTMSHVPEGPFTAKDLQVVSGASAMTVRRAIATLVSDHTLITLGPDPDHTSPGRSPIRYLRRTTGDDGPSVE